MHVSPIQPGEVVRIRDERWRVTGHVPYGDAAILEVGGYDRANQGVRARFLLPAERIQRVATVPAARVVRAARWRAAARLALADAVPRIDSLRAAARADLDVIPFQLEPALAVTRGLGCRMLIADEVGLGKTIQAGLVVAEILERTADGHVLIVCPAALRDQWRHELERRFHLSVAVLDAAGLCRAASRIGAAGNPWLASPVVVTSIDYVKRPEVIRSLESLVWDAAVFDEAHAIAGASARASAARGLARRARFVLMLSATPHSGDDASFRTLCRTGELPFEGPLLLFRRTREAAGLPSSRHTKWLRVRQTSAEMRLHDALMNYARLVWGQDRDSAGAARLAMTVLVKRASSSAASLARSVDRRLRLLTTPTASPDTQLGLPFETTDDDEPSIELSAPGLANAVEERSRLEFILDLARSAARRESKLAALRRLIRRSAEPAIVFTEYRDTLAHIGSVLPGTGTTSLHGGLTLAERRESIHDFTSGGARLLLATDAASEGLNLHHRCRLVINMELPWTPLRLEQRVGRVDRIGQRRRVHAVHLVGRGTAEEHTVARLLERAARSCAVLTPASPEVREDEVAAAVMASTPAPDDKRGPTQGAAPVRGLPSAFVVPDLRDDAAAEAVRISTARVLCDDSGRRGRLEVRPVITVIRHRPSLPRRCWVFRVAVDDLSGRAVWSTLFGIEASSTRVRLTSADSARTLLPLGPSIAQAADHQHRVLVREAGAMLERLRALCVRRERGIADDLGRHRARLAALQPGLFDRRADRAAAAQSAVLDAALERSVARLADLAALQRLDAGARELVFAVVVE